MAHGAQRVDSVLRTLNRTTLPKLHPQATMQWVYGLTGQAGSCMYMSPECYARLPYNEKADVFSFGERMPDAPPCMLPAVHTSCHTCCHRRCAVAATETAAALHAAPHVRE